MNIEDGEFEIRRDNDVSQGFVRIVIDTGNVFATVSDMHFSELRTSVGAGIRYRSPIGPLRIDVGWKVGALRSTDTRRWEFHFSIGEAF